MSATYPIISEWAKEGLKWQYIWQPKFKAFVIPANKSIRLPYEDFTYSYPEILLCLLRAAFDHPSCGFRIEAAPEYDSGTLFQVGAMAVVLSRVEPIMYASIPPNTPPGIYGLNLVAPMLWKDYLRLSVFNADTSPHYCFGFGYLLAALLQKRVIHK